MRARNIKLRDADSGGSPCSYLMNQAIPPSPHPSPRCGEGVPNELGNYISNERGVGLIELLVSILIMAGVVAAIMVAYSSLPAQSSQGSALLVLQQEGSLALEEMSGAIRETTVDSLDVQANQLGTSAGTFSVNNGILYRDFGLAGQETLLGDYEYEQFGMQVDSLIFSDNDPNPNTVTITFTVNLTQDRINRQTGTLVTTTVDSLTFRTQVYPRNRS